MLLRQTLQRPVHGYWDGGAKQVFDWEVEGGYVEDGYFGKDAEGTFERIGLWSANHWFHVAHGKTEKLTLSYAKQHLRFTTRIPSTFEYINS